MAKVNIQEPKIPYKLEKENFQAIYADEDFNLRNCLISDGTIESESINF